MALFFWDASALSKRYTAETGRDVANALFTLSPRLDMASTPWGYLETYSILRRRLNGGQLNAASFRASLSSLQVEVVDDPDFLLLSISDEIVFKSASLIQTHNLNATDATLLRTLLEFACAPQSPPCVMISSDLRLLRAAAAEGLTTLNPQTISLTDLPAFVAAL